jgi:anti-sigma regulatory factor (Ser/Thr protein kinase)
MIGNSELRIDCTTDASKVRFLRHALQTFLGVFPFEQEFLEDVLLASGEILANAVEHGGNGAATRIELFAHGERGLLAIDIHDHGTFIERERVSGRGFGLGIVRQIAKSVTIEAEAGTRVRMLFEPPRRPSNA